MPLDYGEITRVLALDCGLSVVEALVEDGSAWWMRGVVGGAL